MTSAPRDFFVELKRTLEGDVRYDALACEIYSIDASILSQVPIAIALPKHKKDLISAVALARQYNVPITARGAATGISGGCLGSGLIIDTTKYLNRILEINCTEQWVRCEPGVTLDQLNRALAPYGYRLGPDTSAGNRATVGGMVANNASGSHSLRYGKMVDHIVSVELLLSSGELVTLQKEDAIRWDGLVQTYDMRGEIYQKIDQLIRHYRPEIEQNFPKLSRRVSGYNLDSLIKPSPINLAELIVGSEGTLGIITEVALKLSSLSQHRGLCLFYFDDLVESVVPISQLLSCKPLAIELINDLIIELGRISPSMRGKMDWLQHHPKAILAVEMDGCSDDDLMQKLQSCTRLLPHTRSQIMVNEQEIEQVWSLRKAGLGLLLSRRIYSKAVAFIEDIAVPIQHLAPFLLDLLGLFKEFNVEAGIYGHAGEGCLHIRPFFNLHQQSEVDRMFNLMEQVSDLLLKYEGALSGEHGDGLIRSWLNPKMFGPKLYQAFIDLKTAFDPDNLMNPGKIVHAKHPQNSLRISPQTPPLAAKSFLNFSKEGGFGFAVEMCNGNGACRKPTGLMCPAFQAEGDETHSTRAFAQGLRAGMQGKLPLQNMASREIYDLLDHCLECKGCKTECPSQVDMAKMKSEFLYTYHREHGYSWRTRLFGHLDKLNKILMRTPRFFLENEFLRKGIMSFLDIAPERKLPSLSSHRFSKSRKDSLTSNKKIVLFNDTYNEFNTPHLGEAALKVFAAFGYEVIVPPYLCCGRPLISKGFLPKARAYAQRLIHTLIPYAVEGIPIVGLEPSCILTIKDDFPSLISSREAETVAKMCITLDEIMAQLLPEQKLSPTSQPVHVHVHCHQKSLVGIEPALQALALLCKPTVIPTGCCGMAGSFGYEKEHYDTSMRIAEKNITPYLQEMPADAILIANGISCRCQIQHISNRQPLHLIEFIASRVD